MIGPIIGILIPFATFARFLKSGPAPCTNFFPAAPKKPLEQGDTGYVAQTKKVFGGAQTEVEEE